MFGTFKGEAYIGEHKVGLGEVTLNHAELTSKPYNIEKKTNYVDATAFGDTTKTYLVEGAALPKLTLNNDQIGYVKEFQDTPEGVIVTATITDPKFWDYIQKKINPVFEHPKGNGKITAYKGKSVDSLTVDDVKKAAELVKEAGATTNWKWNDESANLYVDQLKKAIQDEVLWTGPKWKMPFTGIKKGITE
jgi:hypothetical protein